MTLDAEAERALTASFLPRSPKWAAGLRERRKDIPFMTKQQLIPDEGHPLAQSNVAIILEALLKAYEGAMMVNVGDAGPVLGLGRRSAHVLASKGKFPVPIIRKQGRIAQVRVIDLAHYLSGGKADGMEVRAKDDKPLEKRRRGRPKKVEAMARRQGVTE